MASITRAIEEHITKMFKETEENEISLRRKDLAALFGCVPSQINYVLRSRFAPENGFVVESQRGGHGYIRIVQLSLREPEERVQHLENLVGNVLSEQDAKKLLTNLQSRGIITPRERLLVEVAIRNQDDLGRTIFDLSPYKRDILRAGIMRRLLTSLALA